MAILWHDWSAAALAKARQENKPILLDIFGTWCRWCHEMDERTYADPDVVEAVNAQFIPIRVDTDKRPDINNRYNQGGWPSTVFLDPEGNVLAGAMFLPPDKLRQLLHQVSSALAAGTAKQQTETFAFSGMRAGTGELTPAVVEKTAGLLRSAFDPQHGGFGEEPKFPSPEALELLLRLHARGTVRDTGGQDVGRASKDYLAMAEASVRGMEGGIFDREAGGFFRYSVSRDWQLPHYEKLLETNADLVRVLALLSGQTKNEWHLNLARVTVDYVLRTLGRPGGGFYGSQDADGEQAFYGLPLEQRPAEPAVDKTVYVDGNGKMLAALLDYYGASKDWRARKAADRTFAFLERACFDTARGFAHYHDRSAHHIGWLLDSVNMGIAYLAMRRVLGSRTALTKAKRLAGIIQQNFWDSRVGGFFDRIAVLDDIRKLQPQKWFPANTRAALFFLDLFDATGEEPHKELAREALAQGVGVYRMFGVNGAEFAIAVDRLFNRPVER